MKCSKITPLIDKLLNGELSEKQKGQLIHHLDRCPECTSEKARHEQFLADLNHPREIAEVDSRLQMLDLPERSPKRLGSRLVLFPVGLTVVLLLAVVVLLHKQPAPEPKQHPRTIVVRKDQDKPVDHQISAKVEPPTGPASSADRMKPVITAERKSKRLSPEPDHIIVYSKTPQSTKKEATRHEDSVEQPPLDENTPPPELEEPVNVNEPEVLAEFVVVSQPERPQHMKLSVRSENRSNGMMRVVGYSLDENGQESSTFMEKQSEL